MTTDTSSTYGTTGTGTGATSDSGAAGAADRAQQTASTAADEGRHVAGVAAGEAKGVAAEAAQQARSVVGDAVGQAKGQLEGQSRDQKDRLAGTLSTFSDDLDRMSESGSGLAADLAHEVADRARSLSRHLDMREPNELLDDVRRYARQRPGTFLLGALAAGVVAGRLLRGTKDAVEAAEATSGPDYTVDVPTSTAPTYGTGTDLGTSTGTTYGTGTDMGTGLGTGTTPPSATGYSSPPAGTGLPSDDLSGGSPA